MGTNQSTLSSPDASSSAEIAPISDHVVDQELVGGSGRMMRTHRLTHTPTGRSVVAKTVWIKQEDREEVMKKEKDLILLKETLRECRYCVAPFLEWYASESTSSTSRAVFAGAAGDVFQATLIRPHCYTTLKDRLESRPFLTDMEKLWILQQLLLAVKELHSRNVVHGNLTTENVGLTSWNNVVLLDVSRSYKAITQLPDDDPSLYLYYFESTGCYLAPERFYSPKSSAPSPQQTTDGDSSPLTPAMDIFSTGCIFLETSLNGERAMDLGDIMDYRRLGSVPPQLEQRLQKIDSSSLRAACRHMMGLQGRLSAQEYLARLDGVPQAVFAILMELTEQMQLHAKTPDRRIAQCAVFYPRIMEATMGLADGRGSRYMARAVGRTMWNEDDNSAEEKENRPSSSDNDNLFVETEALLKKLESLSMDDLDKDELWREEKKSSDTSAHSGRQDVSSEHVPKTSQHKESLLIYLQLVLSNLRHVQRPSTKLVALQILKRLSVYSSDESRLQRMIPSTISLLQDQDPVVRAISVETMTHILQQLRSFPPSDSKVFPQYIYKRVAHLMSDPSLVVRVAFAKSIAVLAETAQRFLDISHAVRLYEAVGGGGGASAGGASDAPRTNSPSFFDEDTTNLLPGEEGAKETTDDQKGVTSKSTVLISSTYNAELAVLQETVSRWVIHITTDQSNQASPPKRALLLGENLARLCNFFGRDGVMAFMLPQILAFLNDRRDWQLRAALFENLTSVCSIVGRGATEHFVLPCLETALVDGQDLVIGAALVCLTKLVDMGLLSRSVLVESRMKESGRHHNGLFQKYAPLILNPSPTVRHSMIEFVFTSCKSLGYPDADVFLLPIFRPYLRYEPSFSTIGSAEALAKYAIEPWTKERLLSEMLRLAKKPIISPSGIQWTSVESTKQVEDSAIEVEFGAVLGGKDDGEESLMESASDPVDKSMSDFVQMLARGRMRTADERDDMGHAVDGSLKLSQQVRFPRQTVAAYLEETRPDSGPKDVNSIQSIESLTQAYGLSLVTATGAVVNQKTLPDTIQHDLATSPACLVARGQWGSESALDPVHQDTSLMASKLQALNVPQLPPQLGNVTTQIPKDPSTTEWRPKIDSLIASSTPGSGHTAPVSRLAVSYDQRFFVSGSFDGTCKVWMLDQVENSAGVLDSSTQYCLPASSDSRARVTDLALLEHSHSIVAGASDGSVHVYRVEITQSNAGSPATTQAGNEKYKASETSVVKRMNRSEGEILAVSHFNNLSASVVVFATQRGNVRGWDLRTEADSFVLHQAPDLGYMTCMALGNDKNWIVSGTSRGFVCLWDVRFQKLVKLWKHNSGMSVNRLATAYSTFSVASLASRTAGNTQPRPFAFTSCGVNECSMFDLLDGSCHQSFKVLDPQDAFDHAASTELPVLNPVRIPHAKGHYSLRPSQWSTSEARSFPPKGPQICTLVGSVGGYEQNYLITGGSDNQVRYWDFLTPSKCFTISGPAQQRPSYDRVDFQATGRMMLCRQAPLPKPNEIDSSRIPRRSQRGLCRPETRHADAVLDLKLIQLPKRGLISCSRDGSVKMWR